MQFARACLIQVILITYFSNSYTISREVRFKQTKRTQCTYYKQNKEALDKQKINASAKKEAQNALYVRNAAKLQEKGMVRVNAQLFQRSTSKQNIVRLCFFLSSI